MTAHQEIVLVVEDEREAREFLTQILELEGFTVVGFANGAEAMAYLSNRENRALLSSIYGCRS